MDQKVHQMNGDPIISEKDEDSGKLKPRTSLWHLSTVWAVMYGNARCFCRHFPLTLISSKPFCYFSFIQGNKTWNVQNAELNTRRASCLDMAEHTREVLSWPFLCKIALWFSHYKEVTLEVIGTLKRGGVWMKCFVLLATVKVFKPLYKQILFMLNELKKCSLQQF